MAGKEVSERALSMIFSAAGDDGEAATAELIDAGFVFEAELYPERIFAFRHPLTREVAYGSQLADHRAVTHAATGRALIELNPDRHDEMAALIASHMEQGGETLEATRWSARAAYWTGNSRPADALRLWRKVTELAEQLDEGEEARTLAVMSRLLQLDFAWRLGMPKEEEDRLAAEAEAIATRTGDRHSLALLRMATSVRPGLPHVAGPWLAAVEETVRLADESGDRHLRIAIRAGSSYAFLCTGRFDEFEAAVEEIVELCDGDPRAGAGIVIGNPLAWAYMAKGLVRRERGKLDEADALFERSLRIATEQGDPEMASWTRSNQSLMLGMRGEPEAGVSLARRNCELTERLGDIFSRTLALANLGACQLLAGEPAAALSSLGEADRIYLGAVDGGDEMEFWRAGLRAEALTGVGRVEEAIEVARKGSEGARERGMKWSLPLALRSLAIALDADGRDGAVEALDEAAEVATESGAMTSLQGIEDARATIGAGAR